MNTPENLSVEVWIRTTNLSVKMYNTQKSYILKIHEIHTQKNPPKGDVSTPEHLSVEVWIGLTNLRIRGKFAHFIKFRNMGAKGLQHTEIL